MSALSVRTAAQADRASRDLYLVADRIRHEGIAAQASLLRTIAQTLGRLAVECAREPELVTLTRIAEECGDAYRALRQVSGELREAGMFDLRVRVEAHATVLGVLHRDALSTTQPIDVKPRSGD